MNERYIKDERGNTEEDREILTEKDWTKKCTCENFQQGEDCEHIGNKVLEEVGLLVDIGIKDGCGQPVLMEEFMKKEIKQLNNWEKEFDKEFTGIMADGRRHFIKPDMDGSKLKFFIRQKLQEQKQEILEKIKKTHDKTNTTTIK